MLRLKCKSFWVSTLLFHLLIFSLSRLTSSFRSGRPLAPEYYCPSISRTTAKTRGTQIIQRLSTRTVLRRMDGRSTLSQKSVETDDFAPAPPDDVIRILALHGRYGSGTSFQESLAPLATALRDAAAPANVRWTFLDAPFDGGSWWTLPRGVRSFEAAAYEEFDASAGEVARALRGGGSGNEGRGGATARYDVVLGHSQGAILTSALWADNSFWEGSGAPERPRGVLLNGVAWPNPYSHLLERTGGGNATQGKGVEATKMMFVIGEKDDINPPEGAEKVKACYEKMGASIATVRHTGGHGVPVSNEVALMEMVKWIIGVWKDSSD